MLYTDTMTADGLATGGSDKILAYLAFLPAQNEHILTRVTRLVETTIDTRGVSASLAGHVVPSPDCIQWHATSLCFISTREGGGIWLTIY